MNPDFTKNYCSVCGTSPCLADTSSYLTLDYVLFGVGTNAIYDYHYTPHMIKTTGD